MVLKILTYVLSKLLFTTVEGSFEPTTKVVGSGLQIEPQTPDSRTDHSSIRQVRVVCESDVWKTREAEEVGLEAATLKRVRNSSLSQVSKRLTPEGTANCKGSCPHSCGADAIQGSRGAGRSHVDRIAPVSERAVLGL